MDLGHKDHMDPDHRTITSKVPPVPRPQGQDLSSVMASYGPAPQNHLDLDHRTITSGPTGPGPPRTRDQ
ncbi:hypothetical protein AVEN_615-1 [Araneus ventricosus]|uniref:Uncharacterized protein n=1 Tax=Araneus ventricosus TaxID=182803 RepID=A0A4Y2EHK8_ARAVE|nr:hypothetical protein AVEN_615-1 [Araneus ventricosus]